MVVGTSICDLVVDPREVRLPGITGVVRDGILPGLYGYEAGQAAVGDMLAWFVETLAPPGAELRGARAGGGRDRPRGERAGRARLVERQPHDPRRRRPQRRALRADAADDARADLPRAARVDRVRQPADHRELRGARPGAERDRRLRRDRREEPADDAAARRHQRAARQRPRLDADPRARRGAVRRGRRRRASRTSPARSPRPDRGSPAATRRTRTRKAIYDRVYAIYRSLYERLGRTRRRAAPRPQAHLHRKESVVKPRIGLLGIMQELYDEMIPGITEHQAEYARARRGAARRTSPTSSSSARRATARTSRRSCASTARAGSTGSRS